jgi:hypothetical protein
MAFSYYTYTGDGTTTQFPVAFGYIRREHVLATVAGAPVTFTFVNSTTIQMDAIPANGAVVRVYRQTPLTAPLVNFTDGSTLVAADLDTNALQSIYTQQELDDSLVDGLAGVIPNGDKGDITTSVGGSVWVIDNGAVTETKVATGAITDTKLATISTAGKVSNSATTATSANTASSIVARDASGNFSAGTITAALTGTASGNSRLVRTTAQLTSGLSIDFTDIPSWAKKITVVLYGVSTDGITPVQIQLGDSGGVATSGYTSSLGVIAGPNVCVIAAYTTGFVVPGGSSIGSSRSGLLTIANIATNIWIASGTFDEPALTSAGYAQGFKDLSATLDRIRLTTVNGTDAFDAGAATIIYEG